MPKKQKQSKLIPGEEKPPGISLGDFMTVAPPRGSKKTSSGVKVGVEEFPDLGQAQTVPNSDNGVGVSSCWGSRPSVATAAVEVVRTDTANATPAVDNKTEKPSGLPYTIGKTKKGSLPIRVENRNKGKKVTVIFNVSGNLKELLSELKHAAGSGGVVREDTVEIQGDKSEFVEKFLKNKLKK
eukprot:GFUD01118897.1.p1 GENE.GFUD01118897.1~~GFUD01118897.1.p1  ORF type:complete len:183 (-),score=63.49 GFUD01118897.1:59-607(-)